MKVTCFLGKLAIAIFVAAIAITLFSLVVVSMLATVLIFGYGCDIHIAWTIPTILMVIIAICRFIGKIYYELFG